MSVSEGQTVPESEGAGSASPPCDTGTILQDEAELGQSAAMAAEAGVSSPPCRVDGYTNWRLIGRGAYGQVWEAHRGEIGERVAFKFLTRRGGSAGLAALREEAKRLVLLREQPGIVQILDCEVDSDPPYIKMCYAAGGSLHQLLLAEGAGGPDRGGDRPYRPLAREQAAVIFRQIAVAMASVHSRGIIHCDLKPSNVLLDEQGVPKVADFGQALLSRDSSPALGTFFYMPPDQADMVDRAPDTRWDVHALGAILYTMLVGQPPRFDARLVRELEATTQSATRLRKYREYVAVCPPPQAHWEACRGDAELARIVDRCLESDPELRFRTAGDLVEALQRRDERATRRRVRIRAGWLAAIALVFVMIPGAWMIVQGVEKAANHLVEGIRALERATLPEVARHLGQNLREQVQLVQRMAGDRRLALQLGRTTSRDALIDELVRVARREGLGHLLPGGIRDREDRAATETAVTSVRIVDNQGQHRAILGEFTARQLEELYGGKFRSGWSWRDWYNGLGDQDPDGADQYPILERTHLSDPIIGKVSEKVSVLISAPVRAANGEVIGLVATQIDLARLQEWLSKLALRGGFLSVVDSRGHFVKHRELDRTRLFDGEGRSRSFWPEFGSQSVEGRSGSLQDLDPFRDPVDGRIYAAHLVEVPLGELPSWGMFLERDRVETGVPIRRLARELAGQMVSLAALGGLAIALALAAPNLLEWWLGRKIVPFRARGD